MPEAIAQLAAISDFRLLVTLNVDELLVRALRTRCAVNEIIHSPYLPTSEAVDLAPDWLKRAGETNLLYLFGKAKSTPVFAIHDEDILEYTHNLLSRGSKCPRRSAFLVNCNSGNSSSYRQQLSSLVEPIFHAAH